MGSAWDLWPNRCKHLVKVRMVNDSPVFGDCPSYPCGECGTSTMWWKGDGIEPCTVCGRVADAYCDFPMGGGKTCDAPLCITHRIAQGGDLLDIDYCPQHSLIARGMVTTASQEAL